MEKKEYHNIKSIKTRKLWDPAFYVLTVTLIFEDDREETIHNVISIDGLDELCEKKISFSEVGYDECFEYHFPELIFFLLSDFDDLSRSKFEIYYELK